MKTSHVLPTAASTEASLTPTACKKHSTEDGRCRAGWAVSSRDRHHSTPQTADRSPQRARACSAVAALSCGCGGRGNVRLRPPSCSESGVDCREDPVPAKVAPVLAMSQRSHCIRIGTACHSTSSAAWIVELEQHSHRHAQTGCQLWRCKTMCCARVVGIRCAMIQHTAQLSMQSAMWRRQVLFAPGQIPHRQGQAEQQHKVPTVAIVRLREDCEQRLHHPPHW